MYTVRRSKQFEQSFKKLQYSGTKNSIKKEIATVIDILIAGKLFPEKYKDHKLIGEFKDYRECHARPDLLLIYQILDDELVLVLINIGSHSELYN